VIDRLGRGLKNLRLSVTDRCNLRCQYCMPETDYVWLPREDVLHCEEISALVDVFIDLGVDRVRLTGGEPLLRRNLRALVTMLASKPGLADLALTTNGVLLAEQIEGLKSAGLRRVTVSLDTLRRERFIALTRFDELDRTKEGIAAASRLYSASPAADRRAGGAGRAAGIRSGSAEGVPLEDTVAGTPHGLKIDSVIIRSVNDDELVDLLEYGRTANAEVRFIEYMDVGGATMWSPAGVVSRTEILDRLSKHYGGVTPLHEASSSAPAERFLLPDGTIFGVIASTTEPFCARCDRSRLTADGMWYLCLYASSGIDLRGALRSGASREELKRLVAGVWKERTDRGAEDRLAMSDRRAFVPLKALRQDPHLEMHTRGG